MVVQLRPWGPDIFQIPPGKYGLHTAFQRKRNVLKPFKILYVNHNIIITIIFNTPPLTTLEFSWKHMPFLEYSLLYMGVSKNNGTPKSSHFKRVFHYFHHPFWGTIIFGNTHKGIWENVFFCWNPRFFFLSVLEGERPILLPRRCARFKRGCIPPVKKTHPQRET